jgi:hypothetical protein
MATSPERLKIMKMVQDGKITAEEGIELLDMLSEKGQKGKNPSPDSDTTPKSAPQWFRVVVTDATTGRTRVNVRLPVSLVNAGMKMGAKFSPQVDGLDQGTLSELIKSGATGKVIDVYDDDDGEHVEVFIE